MESGHSRVSVEDGAKHQLVESFVAVTSSSREEALFFLESHNWDLSFAIHSFFEASDPTDDAERPLHRPQQRRRRQQEQEEEEGEGEDEDDEDYVPPADPDLNSSPPRPQQQRVHRQSAMTSQDKKGKKAAGGSRPSGGIHTLADLNREPSGPGSDSDSDGPQEYYTGGEKSGMLVQDPSKRNDDVDALFEQAKQMGAHQGSIDDSRPTNSRVFTGTSRLLSGETLPLASRPQQPENIVHDIVFWTNGFTVDDGPLRKFDDPENASFMESIKKSEYPKELEPSDKRSIVHVNLIRRGEKCPERPERKIPFQGVGRTLGGSSSTTAEPSEPTVSTTSTGNSSSLVGFSVDESLPSTSIQLRLADGTRMVARFNNHHTIGDIRSFIDASRPGATRNYKLQTVGFPPKQLMDEAQTVEQAGLANSVVIQRL